MATTIVDASIGLAGTSRQLYSDNKSSYANAHDATTADTSDVIAETTAQNILHNSDFGGGATDYFVRRAELDFDTSAIPDGDTITAAVLTLPIAATGGADADNYSVVLLDNTNNGNLQNPLATEDFNDFTTTSIGSLDLTSLTNIGANVDITLTSYTCISKTGVTKIGLRLSGDINNNDPAGVNNLRINTTIDVPYLTVTHETPAAADRRKAKIILNVN